MYPCVADFVIIVMYQSQTILVDEVIFKNTVHLQTYEKAV
jgi:hypothetical protein